MRFFLFLLFLVSTCSIELSIIKTGLIYFPNGVQLIKLHHLILLKDVNDKIVVDLIPDKINKYDICRLILGKDIQAKIRVRRISNNILEKDIYSFLCSPKGKAITNENVDSLSLKTFLHKIKNWGNLKKNNYTMNIYKRNCQHYRYFVEQEYKSYFSSK
jgi:hypothetical protein